MPRDELQLDANGALSVVKVYDEGEGPDAEDLNPEPFGGKGDHDGNGKVGGAKPAVHHRKGRRL